MSNIYWNAYVNRIQKKLQLHQMDGLATGQRQILRCHNPEIMDHRKLKSATEDCFAMASDNFICHKKCMSYTN